MTDTNMNPLPSAATLPRPRHFLGNQPIVAVARYESESGCNWNMLYHVTESIYSPFSGPEHCGYEEDEVDCSDWPLYDYDCEVINRWFCEELDLDGGNEISWADICGMFWDEEDPLHVLRSCNTKVDASGKPIDDYWVVSVLNRDDAEFWEYLLDGGSAIGIDWEPRQEDFAKVVVDWARENPESAEGWLNASPSPMDLIGESDDLTKLIKKIKRAIKQGQLSED